MKRHFLFYILVALFTFSSTSFSQNTPIFEEDILPILDLNCMGCHGANDPQAMLNMESISGLMKGGNSGKAIVPGNSKESLLYQLITGEKQPIMPPEPLLPLEDSDIALVKTWIDNGAPSKNPPKIEQPEPKEAAVAETLKESAPPSSAPPSVEQPKEHTEDVHGNDPFFDMIVRPIFEAKCAKCHNTESPKAGLVAGDLNSVLQEKFIVPNQPEKSLLYTAITGISKKQMPPKSQPQLSGTEKEIIRRWIVSLSSREKAEIDSNPVQEKLEVVEEKIEKTESVETIMFEEHILPIFKANCAGCHGDTNPKAGLSVTNIASILDGGFVLPGKPGESPLCLSVSGIGKVMPPKPMPPLEKEEISLIQKWIAQGAKHGAAVQETISDDEPVSLSAVKESQYGNSQIGAVAFHPTKPLFAVGRLYEVQLFEYDVQNGDLILKAVFSGHSHLIRALKFSPDGTILAAGGGRPALQGEIMLWDVDTLQLKKKMKGHRDNIYALAFTPEGNTLASCSYDRTIMMWDVKSGDEKSTLEDHVDSVYDIEFSPDGKRLASAAGDRTVKIWDAQTGERLYTLSDAEKELYTVTFHPSGDYVAAGGVDRMIRVWELGETDGYQVQSKFAHDGAILNLAYSPDGSVLYSSSDDSRLKAWDTSSYSENAPFENQSDWVFALDIHPNGKLAAAGRYDGTFDIYDVSSRKKIFSYNKKSNENVSDATQKIKKEDQPEPETAFASTKTTDKKESVNTDPFQVGALEGTGTYPSFLSSINPKVVTYGNEIEFILMGKNLADAEILPDDPNLSAEITEVIEGEVSQFVRSSFDTGKMIVDSGVPFTIKFTMTISDEAHAGIHRVRVRTPLATTNTQSFLIEEKPAIDENEGNDTIANAQQVTLPNILAGRMNDMGDVDVFAFDAEEGEELTFDVIASAIGSGIDSRLQILDSEGSVLSRSIDFEDSRDAKMGHRFESAGTYYLQITDSLLRQGGTYRIHVTKRPFITQHDPIGIQKGKSTEVQIKGFNLDGNTSVSVTVPEDFAGSDYTLPFKNEYGHPIQSVRLAVSDEQTIQESNDVTSIKNPHNVTVPVHINGSIYDSEAQTDADYFRFTAQEGQPIVIEVAAQRYDSPLDSKIEILHENGEPVETATVRSVAQTYTVLSDRDSRSSGMRLNSWKDFDINDYVMVGSEIIRITRLPDYPDEDVAFAANTRRGWRTGFFGTTPGHHAVDTNVYKVSIHPPHTAFSPNGMPVHKLYAQNDDGGAPIYGKDSYYQFNPPADGNYIVRISDAQSFNDPSNIYRLSIRSPKPDFNLFVNADRINIQRESKVPVSVTIDRLDGFDGEVKIDIPNLPEGFKTSLTHIPPGEESSSFVIEALPDAKSTDPNKRFSVDAYAKINGQWVKRSGSFGAITVTFDPDVKCVQEPKHITLVPGGTAKVTVKVSRHNGFEDRLPINLRNLPLGVYVLDTGLNGILVLPDETERSFTIYAEPWVKPQAFTVFSTLDVETRSALPHQYATAPSVLHITDDPQAIAESRSEYLQQKKKF